MNSQKRFLCAICQCKIPTVDEATHELYHAQKASTDCGTSPQVHKLPKLVKKTRRSVQQVMDAYVSGQELFKGQVCTEKSACPIEERPDDHSPNAEVAQSGHGLSEAGPLSPAKDCQEPSTDGSTLLVHTTQPKQVFQTQLSGDGRDKGVARTDKPMSSPVADHDALTHTKSREGSVCEDDGGVNDSSNGCDEQDSGNVDDVEPGNIEQLVAFFKFHPSCIPSQMASLSDFSVDSTGNVATS